MSAASDRLFGELAASYDDHFAVAHRHAYDELSWEFTLAELPAGPATVVDVGSGTGRWGRRLVDLGYTVIGIEPCGPMAHQAALRVPEMRQLRSPAETAVLPAGSVDAVLAMGSLQYADDPAAAFLRAAAWLRPGGVLCALVDSRMALGLELMRADRRDEAMQRLDTSRGLWSVGSSEAALHLFDQASLCRILAAAGLHVVSVRGLLVGATIWGRDQLTVRLQSNWIDQFACERELAGREEFADLGKQLFAVARRSEPDSAHLSPAPRPRR